MCQYFGSSDCPWIDDQPLTHISLGGVLKVIAVLTLILCVGIGCGPNAYQLAKQDLASQYASLDQINDLGLRQQRFAEIKQREIMLEAQEINQRQALAQVFSAWAISQAIQNQPAQPTPVFNYFGWSK